MISKKLSFLLLNLSCIISLYPMQEQNRKYVGVFTRSDKQISGITFGNWGSRPYEYAWVTDLVSIEGKRVIDLGVGLPSQYDWFKYVVDKLKPSFYSGIDCDSRIKNELVSEQNYEICYMNMADLGYPDKSFDIAYCISTFEHIPYEILMKSIQETHRVLKDDGILIITLDEEWDKDQPSNYSNGWNTLELQLLEKGLFKRGKRSFGLPEFLALIKEHFVLSLEDAIIDGDKIISKSSNHVYYDRRNKDNNILNSGLPTNSCVSYAVLKKVAH